MPLGIDARYFSHGLIGGVQTNLANLLLALLAQADGQAVLPYADTRRPFEAASVPESVAKLIEPRDEPALAACLTSVLSDAPEAEGLGQLDFARAAAFVWRRPARQIWAGYRQALAA
jgi:hypothetical protein